MPSQFFFRLALEAEEEDGAAAVFASAGVMFDASQIIFEY